MIPIWTVNFRVQTTADELAPLIKAVERLSVDARAVVQGPADRHSIFSVSISAPPTVRSDVEAAINSWIAEHPRQVLVDQ